MTVYNIGGAGGNRTRVHKHDLKHSTNIVCFKFSRKSMKQTKAIFFILEVLALTLRKYQRASRKMTPIQIVREDNLVDGCRN